MKPGSAIREGRSGDGRKLRQGLWLCGLVLAALILLAPSFLDQISALKAAGLIARYEEELADKSRSARTDMLERAVLYNQKIAEEQAKTAFSYRGGTATDPGYEGLLGGTDGIMGYLEIPRLQLNLPVYHGTSAATLRLAAGHLYGTSLPVGGLNTHAVIAAHSGLRNAELFTHLPDLEEGDLFYMHVTGEIHAYEVAEINIVYPAEEDPYLQVMPGRDLITLYTCTPSGINDHRLLVRGRRVLPDPSAEVSGTKSGERTLPARRAISRLVLIALIPLVLLLIGIRRMRE